MFTTLTRWSKWVCFSQLLTIGVYISSIIFLRKTIDVSVIDLEFMKNVVVIVLFSWGPLQVMKLIRIRMDPT